MKRHNFGTPKRYEGELLTVGGYPVVEEGVIYEKVWICLYSVVLCFIKERMVDILEKQSREEKCPDLKVYGYISLSGER